MEPSRTLLARWIGSFALLSLGSCSGMRVRPAEYSNDLGMDFVAVAAPVEFHMGSPRDEVGRQRGELRHRVELVQSYYVQTTEVTQDQWLELMESNPSEHAAAGGDGPVEGVTWYEAVEFCNRLSEREGLAPAYAIDGEDVTWNRSAEGYRLPTEAEWEYAARGGGGNARDADTGELLPGSRDGALPTGPLTYPDTCVVDPNLDPIAWYCGNAAGTTHPVAAKDANQLGLFDMHGNAWEWCWDGYAPYDVDDPEESLVDPTGDADADSKCVRGGGAYDLPSRCRSANRNARGPSLRALTGVRVVRYVNPD